MNDLPDDFEELMIVAIIFILIYLVVRSGGPVNDDEC